MSDIYINLCVPTENSPQPSACPAVLRRALVSTARGTPDNSLIAYETLIAQATEFRAQRCSQMPQLPTVNIANESRTYIKCILKVRLVS